MYAVRTIRVSRVLSKFPVKAMAAFAPARKFPTAAPSGAQLGEAPKGFVQLGDAEYVLYETFSARAPVCCKPRLTGPAFAAKHPGVSVYARIDKASGAWALSEGKSKRLDKIFLKREFAESIPEFMREVGGEADNAAAPIIDDAGVESAPDIVELELEQRFTDENGEVVRIETRGERTVDGVFFRVKDVMTAFKMNNLTDTILEKKSAYVNEVHYKFFNTKKTGISRTSIVANSIKKELFLTYEGILRVLFASHSPNVKPFIRWAVETLFVAQMGSRDQKTALSAKLLGATPEAVRAVFDGYEGGCACIYLMDLGLVSKLRGISALAIPEAALDTSRIYKYGFTKDLSRRMKEHAKAYGELTRTPIVLSTFYVVDPRYMAAAEADVRGFFRAFHTELPAEGQRELVVISADEMVQVKKTYRHIGNDYSGNTKCMQEIIDGLRNEIFMLSASIEMTAAVQEREMAARDKENEAEVKMLRIQIDRWVETRASAARCAELEVENRDLKLVAMAAELAQVRRSSAELEGALASRARAGAGEC